MSEQNLVHSKKVRRSRILVTCGFVLYLMTMLLPYKSINQSFGELDDAVYYSSGYGFDSDYILLFLLFVPAIIVVYLRHSLTSKILLFITALFLFGLAVLMLYTDFEPDYSKPNSGFYVFMIAAVLVFVGSVIKLPLVVLRKKGKAHDLLDDF